MGISRNPRQRPLTGGAREPVYVTNPVDDPANVTITGQPIDVTLDEPIDIVVTGQPVDVVVTNAVALDPTTAVIIHDADGDQVEVDGDVHALTSIAVPHHEVHEGETFYVSRYVEAVADDASIAILLQIGATKEAHCTWAAACGGDAEVQFTEGPTINVVGTAMTEFNMNRHSAEVSTVIATHTPTVVGGTLMPNYMLPGGTGGNAVGGTTRQNTEWVLDEDEDYVLEVFNRSGNAKNMSLVVQWYEEAMA